MAKKAQYSVVDSKESFEALLTRVRQAQQEFARYSQERVDAIFKAAAMAANQARIPLAKEAVAETGMGVVEDKVIKNHYASEYIYNTYKDVKTCGVMEEDQAFGVQKHRRACGRDRGGDPHHQPHLHRHLQDACSP